MKVIDRIIVLISVVMMVKVIGVNILFLMLVSVNIGRYMIMMISWLNSSGWCVFWVVVKILWKCLLWVSVWL